MKKTRRSWAAALAFSCLPAGAYAQSPDPAVNAAVPPGAPPAPAVPPPPYSLPWQLRPAAAANVVRSDTSVATYEAAGSRGSTVVSTLLASYKVTPTLAPLVRLGVVRNEEPGPMLGASTAFINPIVGVTWSPKLGPPPVRTAGFVAVTVPVGMGGDKPAGMDATAAAVAKGIPARSAMDNAMFAVNYFTAIAGADVAYVAHGLTVQAEVTVLELLRARNEKFAPDAARTNFTSGLHVGYFIVPALSLGGEVRYQRWLSTPKAVAMNPVTRETVTFAVGPRAHFKLGGTTWIRPGLSYSRGLDAPLSKGKYHILQLDVPVAF
jgi:hypothetical protein